MKQILKDLLWLKKNTLSSIRFLCVLLFTILIVYIIIYHTNIISTTRQNKISIFENIYSQQSKYSEREFPSYNEVDENVEIKKRKTKYILVWTPFIRDLLDFDNLKGNENFKKLKCPVSNCFITHNRRFFRNGIHKFDAIVFNGKSFTNNQYVNILDLPQTRSPHQVYIFYETRPAYDNYVCVEQLDKYFNWTMTYKLNSDIPRPILNIKNKAGHIIGPKIDMHWIDDTVDEETVYIDSEPTRTSAVFWLDKRCTRKTERKKIKFVNDLRNSLSKYGLEIDMYGKCGIYKCKDKDCTEVDRKEYRFFLFLDAVDNEFYITEELLKNMEYGLVPIVMKGSNISSFLPPYAYIDGTKKTVNQIATLVAEAMMSTRKFQNYFRWKKYYTYDRVNINETLCSLCSALNNDEKVKKHKVYENFLEWWNPNYASLC